MKICIIGSGGVGGYLGAALSLCEKYEVTMVARGKHALLPS